jgi:acyl-coenzyme A thioesterase PaaI-like protein
MKKEKSGDVALGSLQRTHAPHSTCFGCGPSNPKGLRINSRVVGDEVHCEFLPEVHHEAFPGVVNGGILGVLLDCHCNWAGANGLHLARGSGEFPCTVTAKYSVEMKKPTPSNGPLLVRARVREIKGKNGPTVAVVEGSIEVAATGEITATGEGVFVAVGPGHPGYQRWSKG